MSTVTCKHPKFNTLLHVTNNPKRKQHLEFSGNPNKALDMPHNIAQKVRDDVLQHKTQVVIHRT